jgi:aspartate/methionine/tyrosine aminotransferase
MTLAPFKLERFFAEYEFNVPYLLCASDCQSMSLGELLDLEPGASGALAELWLGYTESQGHPALRQAIAGLYESISPEQVLVHAGAEEAIYGFVNAVLRAGDHAIVHWPCYQSLFEVAHSQGCEVTRWAGREEAGWALDLDFLRDHIRDTTRAVIVNCPHNPTGYLMSRRDQAELGRLSREHGLVVFSDEVYRGLEYNPADRLPAFCDLDEKAVSLGVMSKSYGLAGLRIGWIATRNRAIHQAMAAFKDYTTICSSAPSEFLAALALRHGQEIVDRNRRIICDNLDVLDAFFGAHASRFRWQPPQAGPIAFPALLDEPSESFCERLVQQAGVLLLPGTVYGAEYDRNFRIGFGRRNMPESIERLASFLQGRSRPGDLDRSLRGDKNHVIQTA